MQKVSSKDHVFTPSIGRNKETHTYSSVAAYRLVGTVFRQSDLMFRFSIQLAAAEKQDCSDCNVKYRFRKVFFFLVKNSLLFLLQKDMKSIS